MTIRLYNTKTRALEDFAPIDPMNVRMYVCGPTVYDRAHLGNARPVVVFDVLNRLLRHEYPGAVTYARNFTDVDDKINAEAVRRRAAGASGTLEELIRQRTDETIAWYHADMDALGAMRPDHEPRATEYIGPMVAMIADLIAKGHAYAAEGHVLFRVRSYAGYGGLSGRTVDDMIAGARVEVAPFKEDPMDFVLWKPSDGETPGWDSPWGRGRPGWHIECSAMSHELLGASFDIHGGGIDLQFPHHENEIAQSCCAHPEADFAKVWLHNEMLLVEGKKMSKSLGNFFTVRDLLDQGVPGEVIRFVFLMTHYRKPMDWTEAKRKEAETMLRKVAAFLNEDELTKPWLPWEYAKPPEEAVIALSNDLNTSLVLTLIGRYLKAREEGSLVGTLKLLGFDPKSLMQKFSDFAFSAHQNEYGSSVTFRSEGATSQRVEDLIIHWGDRLSSLRKDAVATKDFSESDRIKSALSNAGLEVRIAKDGVELLPGANFDPAKLEALK